MLEFLLCDDLQFRLLAVWRALLHWNRLLVTSELLQTIARPR